MKMMFRSRFANIQMSIFTLKNVHLVVDKKSIATLTRSGQFKILERLTSAEGLGTKRSHLKVRNVKKTFGIVHLLMPFGRSYMQSIITYAVSRILKKGDSIQRVTSDLNELHHVEVSIGKVEE